MLFGFLIRIAQILRAGDRFKEKFENQIHDDKKNVSHSVQRISRDNSRPLMLLFSVRSRIYANYFAEAGPIVVLHDVHGCFDFRVADGISLNIYCGFKILLHPYLKSLGFSDHED